MSDVPTQPTEADVRRVIEKLVEFRGTLPGGEQSVLDYFVASATSPEEVEGFTMGSFVRQVAQNAWSEGASAMSFRYWQGHWTSPGPLESGLSK